MTAKTLNALKGWPQPAAVDFNAQFDPTALATLNPILAGSVLSLNSSGNYLLGVGNANVMPLFLFNNSDDPDVQNYGGDPSTDAGNWVGVTPTGGAMTLVAIGAYELVSTQFVAGSYPPNTPLTSPAQGSSNNGSLVAGTLGTNMIVGFVSRGVVDNGYGHDALAFWPFPVFVY
jgi:hypothetical protein